MKRVLVAAGLFGLLGTMSVTAFAGKEEREFMKNEVMPAVKAAESKYKTACGCALAITVNDAGLKSTSELRPIKSLADRVGDGATEHCTDAESKKALCQMKSLLITKSAEITFTFKAGKGIATTDGQSSPSWEMFIAELDK
jgi:hypothetical protein